MITSKRKETRAFILRNSFMLFALLVLINIYESDNGLLDETFHQPLPYISMIIFYSWMLFHNTILINKLFFKKKYIFYIISLIAGILIYCSIKREMSKLYNHPPDSYTKLIFNYTIVTLFCAFAYLTIRYFREKKAFYQLKSIKREIELERLKSQLHPHFLFNALNNIYSYTLNENKFGNELILKLSKLMRFIVETSHLTFIKVYEEADFIENYIMFERERLGERCKIIYSKKINSPDKNIPPFILFPFIENAFKHGTNSIRHSTIEILIEDSHDYLRLSVKNDISSVPVISTQSGLPNATKRLELLYPDKHKLTIKKEDSIFIVDLILKYE